MMKITIYIFTLCIAVCGCNSGVKERTEESADTLSAEVPREVEDTISIKEESLYDPAFVKGLADYKEPIKIIGNYLVINDQTIFFPEDLPLNKKVTFSGERAGRSFELSVTRTNFTNLNYYFRLSGQDNETIYNRSGEAILVPMFFLASEVDEDTETGTSYGSSEYRDNSADCSFGIRIEIGKGDDGKQRAMITYNCKGQNTLNLDACPTLRTE